MQLEFTKMHGCGNDYIYLDCRETGLPENIAEWSRTLSRRHFSIGADGIICICPPVLAVFSLPLAIPYYYISRAFHRRRALR